LDSECETTYGGCGYNKDLRLNRDLIIGRDVFAKLISKYRLILFDFDGVLVDSEAFYLDFWSKNLFNYNIFFSEKDLIGKSNRQFLSQFDLTNFQIENLIIEKHKSETAFFKDAKMEISLKSLIERLSDNFKLAVVSNNSELNITNYLNNNKCINYFNQIISYDSGLKPKPSPDMYFKAISWLQVRKQETLIIEDSPIGFESAKNAEIDFVKFNFLNLEDAINKIYIKLQINI
jgi:beta-phosphoglucomutase